MRRVVWSELALDQLEAMKTYLEQFNLGAAVGVVHYMVAAGDSLANFALRGRPVPNTELRELVTSYPYVIRYRITRDEVRILRVRHTSRQPTVSLQAEIFSHRAECPQYMAYEV